MATPSPNSSTPFWQSVPGFVLKIFLGSTAIAIAIKAGGPYLPIPATAGVALGMVLTPALLFAVLLIGQQRR